MPLEPPVIRATVELRLAVKLHRPRMLLLEPLPESGLKEGTLPSAVPLAVLIVSLVEVILGLAA